MFGLDVMSNARNTFNSSYEIGRQAVLKRRKLYNNNRETNSLPPKIDQKVNEVVVRTMAEEGLVPVTGGIGGGVCGGVTGAMVGLIVGAVAGFGVAAVGYAPLWGTGAGLWVEGEKKANSDIDPTTGLNMALAGRILVWVGVGLTAGTTLLIALGACIGGGITGAGFGSAVD